jgi:RHS repeat-associated protein
MLSKHTGSEETAYSYEPFGRTSTTGTSPNPFQYTGRENDGTGLYYYRARFYSPTLHRFTSEDPGGSGYAYANNNPINGIDPHGLVTIIVHGCCQGGYAPAGFSGNLGHAIQATGEAVFEYSYHAGPFHDPWGPAVPELTRQLQVARTVADARGEELNIIAHSWGAGVSYSAIKASGVRIDNFVTVGQVSPFTFKPRNVRRWTNIYSSVGDTLLSDPAWFADANIKWPWLAHSDYLSDPAVIGSILQVLGLGRAPSGEASKVLGGRK